MTKPAIKARLEELRAEIRAERISYGEIAELQGLAEHIDSGDVELLEWAGVPEHSTSPCPSCGADRPHANPDGATFTPGTVCPSCGHVEPNDSND